MSKTIELLEQRQLRKGRPRFKAGDTVRVHFQVIEGQRRRIQVFEGIVIKRQGPGVRETFSGGTSYPRPMAQSRPKRSSSSPKPSPKSPSPRPRPSPRQSPKQSLSPRQSLLPRQSPSPQKKLRP